MAAWKHWFVSIWLTGHWRHVYRLHVPGLSGVEEEQAITAQNRATLKAVFETGDVPDGTDYADHIDSSLNLVETSAQSVASPVTFSASAAFTGTVTAGSINVLGALTVSANANVVGVVTAGSVDVLGALRVSAATSLEGAVVLGGALAVVTAQTTATASGAVGGSTVPATATKYLKIAVSGNTYNIALYPSV